MRVDKEVADLRAELAVEQASAKLAHAEADAAELANTALKQRIAELEEQTELDQVLFKKLKERILQLRVQLDDKPREMP